MLAYAVNKFLYNAPEEDLSSKTPVKHISNFPCLVREAKTPKRLIVFLHGNESSLDDLHNSRALHAFGDTETVLALTYPGYPYAREPRGSASNRDQDVINYVLAPLRIAAQNFDEVWLFGHSLGAAIALAVCNQFRPTGAAIVSPFSKLKDVLKNPFAKYAVGERWNNVENIHNLCTKCYICHGLLDNIVPATQSSLLFSQCNVLRKKRYVISNMSHSLTSSAMAQIVQNWSEFAGAPRNGNAGLCTLDAH